jgi:hypothetical protein
VGVSGEALFDESYARVKADLDALKPEELLQVNLDVTAAVTSTLGLLPEVKALREQIVKELPSFDIAAFDKLEDYALALSFANTTYLAATQPPDDLLGLNEEAGKMHDRLLADAKALAAHGLLDGGQLAQLVGGNGYKPLAQDLQLLSQIMRVSWNKIENKSATTADDLKAAAQMSVRLMRIVGLREQGPALLAAATDQRLRAFTRFITVYEDARRAVGYLRARQGDADTIAPSLYPGRPRKRASQTEPAVPTTPQPATGFAGTAPVSADSTQPIPLPTPAQIAAATAAAAGGKSAPASKDPFLT